MDLRAVIRRVPTLLLVALWALVLGNLLLTWRLSHRPPEPPPTPAPHGPPPSAPTLYGSSDPFAYCSNLTARGTFDITCPAYGAKCDNATDDHVAIQAALDAAVAVGGTVKVPPNNPAGARSVCLTSTQLKVNGAIGVEGELVNFDLNKGPIIKATATMESLFVVSSLHLWTGGTLPGIAPAAHISRLVLDCNRNCTQAGILRNSDAGSHYEQNLIVNSTTDGIQATGRTYPLVLGALTPGGGAPSTGVTLTQVEQHTGYGEHLETGTANFQIKFDTAGGLGVATYVTSIDGGATFTLLHQTVQPNSNIMLGMGVNTTYLPYPSGLQLQFASQTYPLNGTYSFTVTVPSDYGNGSALNSQATILGCQTAQNGTIFTTLRVPYSGSPFGGDYYPQGGAITLLTGTVAATANSQFLTFTGSSDLTAFPFREGDHIFVGNTTLDPNASYFMIAGIEDKNTIVLSPPSNSWPQTSYSGEDVTFAHGAGYFETNGTEIINNKLIQFNSQLSASDIRIAGLHGANVDQLVTGGAALLSVLIGGSNQFTHDSVFIHPDLGESHQAMVTGLARGVEFLGSGRGPQIIGTQPYSSQFQGSIAGYNGSTILMTQLAVSLEASFTIDIFSTAGHQFPGPDYTGTMPNTSFLKVKNTHAPYLLMTGAPTILPPTPERDGAEITLVVDPASNPFVLQNDANSATKLVLKCSYWTMAANDQIHFRRYQSKWIADGGDNASSLVGQMATGGCYNILQTSDATPTDIWAAYTGSGYAGKVLRFDVLAQSGNGACTTGIGCSTAQWLDCAANWSGQTFNSATNFQSVRIPSPITFGNGSAWNVSIFNESAGGHPFQSHIYVTGDASGFPVDWMVIPHEYAPPTFSIAGASRSRAAWALVALGVVWLRRRRANDNERRRHAA